MRTISRRSTRVIAEIKAMKLPIRCYTLSSNFVAFPPADPEYPWRLLAEGRAKLRDNEDGTYRIVVHGNEWYELGPSGFKWPTT